MSGLRIPIPASARRDQPALDARGVFAESMPRTGLSGSSTATGSQTLYGSIVGLLAGDVVTSVAFIVAVVASAPTLGKVGVYTKAGVLLGSSADFSGTLLGTTGVKSASLTAPLTITATDAYYLAFLNVAGTGAALWRGFSSGGAGFAAIGSGYAPFPVQNGQADLPANATLAGASGSIAYWLGAS